MEEDLIKESATRSKKPTNTPTEQAQNHLQIDINVNKRKAPASQSKSNKTAKNLISWSTEKVEVFLIF